MPELQLEQALPPAPGTVLGTPPALVVKAAKVDILRRAGWWHFGQSATSPDWLKGRIISNFELHSEQTYSYIGIIRILPFTLSLSKGYINSLTCFLSPVKMDIIEPAV